MAARVQHLPTPFSIGAPNVSTMAGNATLNDDSAQAQVLNPNGSDRTVTIPAAISGTAGLWFAIKHAGTANTITVGDGTNTLAVLFQGDMVLVACSGAAWSALQGDKPLWEKPQTIDMADAALALVHGTAGAGEAKLIGNVLFVDPNSGQATEILTLPPVATSVGLELRIYNTGGEGIICKDVATATVITLDTAQCGSVACNGTLWYGFIGGIT